MIGTTVSHYRILEKLGEGGMGVVYQAEDTRLERRVALKFLPPDLTRDPASKKRFIREARAASALEHQNICNIHEIDETEDGQTFIAMACYEGETLKERLRRGPLEIGEALGIALQVARGLTKAHSQGIVHRDIKPANLFVTAEGIVKIVDFGIAKLMGESDLTGTGAVHGTVSYMSPEQTRGEDVDFRTDLWSLGVVLYEMLTGRPPFRGEYEQAVAYSILHEQPEPPTGERDALPAGVTRLMMRCLAKRAEERHASDAEFVGELLRLQDGEPTRGVRRHDLRGNLRLLVSKPAFRFVPVLLVLVVFFVSGRTRWLSWLGFDPIPRKMHLAILPFTNIGSLPENQAFCDGLFEVLTSKLSQLEEFQGALWVVPSSDVREREVSSVREAKRNFGVNLAVTASMQLDGDRRLLTLNLVDARSLRQLNSAVMHLDSSDVRMMQYGVLDELADMLKIEIEPRKRDAIRAGTTHSARAYESYVLGLGHLRHGESIDSVDTAIALFQDALREDTTFASAHAALGEAYRIRYDLKSEAECLLEGLDCCNHALALNPRITDAYITKGQIHNQTGRYQEAIETFIGALAVDPMNADAFLGLAIAHEARGDLAQAEQTFRQAIRLRPDYWDGYNHLGAFLYSHGRYEEAIEQFRRVIVLTPENPKGYTNLGSMYWALERPEEAVEMYERSLSIHPTFQAYSNLGTLHFYLGNYGAAARMYEEALRLSDREYRLWAHLAESLLRSGAKPEHIDAHFRKAILLAEQRLGLNPRDTDVLSDLASYYANIGATERALAYIRRVIALEPSDLDDLFRIAEVYELTGRRNEALQWFGTILDMGYALPRIDGNPDFDALQADPRFQELLKRGKADSPPVGE